MKLCTLASGSSGNATVISDGTTRVIVDAGISAKRIDEGLAKIGLTGEMIGGVLITHEHVDHCQGLNMFCKRHNVPVFANKLTMDKLIEYGYVKKVNPELLNTFEIGEPFSVGTFSVTSFHTSHDCINPVGFKLTSMGISVAVTTDLGIVTEEIKENLCGCKALVLESNHDIEVLKMCSYPYLLRKRIASELGHLSNMDSANLAVFLAKNGAGKIILGHLSLESNTPELASVTYRSVFKDNNITSCGFVVAPRNEISEIVEC